jgi:transposase
MGLYCGIDLHATNSWLCVIDETGRAQLETRVPNQIEVVRARLEPYREELAAVAVESTFNWYWLLDGLAESGYAMRLANPSAMKQYEGLKYTDDRHDARWIAEMLRLGILPTGYIYPRATRSVRDLLRHRTRLVRNRTMRLLTLQNVLARETGRRVVGNELKRQTLEDLSRLGLSRETNLALSSSLELIELLDRKISEIEKSVVRGTRARPELRLLRTVGGIGQALGLTILLETGEISRFRSVRNYVSYSRLVATERRSNQRKKGEANRKNGNPYLSWAFSEAAHFACRFQPEARRFFDRKRARTNDIVAIRALAHKLARACYFILRDRVAYDSSLLFRN